MILYRDMTYKEFSKLREGKMDINPLYNGMHFFRYGEHARTFLPQIGEMILKCDIPEELIIEEAYVNFYPYKSFAVPVPIPEYVIDKGDFERGFMREVNPNLRNDSKFINGVKEYKIYDKFLKDLYIKWKECTPKYYEDRYGFYDYVMDYLNGRELDEIIEKYALENKKRRLLRRD